MMRRGAVGVLACSAGLALSCGGRTTGSYPRDLDASSSRLVDSASSPADSATSGTTGGATGGTPSSAAPAGAVGRDGAAGAQGSDMTTAADDSGAASASAESGATGGDAGPGGETGCAASFEASFEHPCSGPVLPSSEQERVKARYVKSCENSLTFPGAASEMQLSACASVTLASDCRQTLNPWAIPECVFRGTLPNGSVCNFGGQCRSTRCLVSGGLGLCGTCAPPVADGQPCATGLDCQPGSACDNTRDAAVCEPVVQEAAGASCGGTTADCAPGLYCDMTAAHCAAFATEGAACDQQDACGPTLACIGGTCQSRGDAGASCQFDSDCNLGFGCSDTSQTCGAVTWVGSGQPCGGLTRCLVGQCSSAGTGSPGSCPTVLADGQACGVGDSNTMCDQFADCINGRCAPQDSTACR
ncbi:MAG TPA: hypothetical protein VKU41_01270 [Polyangiaceae bacterium]|nr:hypothetical protein [Polyangiaceae bacterium]